MRGQDSAERANEHFAGGQFSIERSEFFGGELHMDFTRPKIFLAHTGSIYIFTLMPSLSAPPKRKWERRLSPAWNGLKVGGPPLLVEKVSVPSLRQFLRIRGSGCVQRLQPSGKVKVWSVAP